VAELLGFVGAVISMICSQSGQLARFGNFSQAQANQALQVSSRLNQPWSPIAWGARGLVEIGEGNWALGLGLFGLTVGLAVGIFFFSLAASERLYFSGWARMQTVQRRKRGVRAVRQPVASRQLTGLGAFIPSQVHAILGKDLLVMRRDLRNMSQLVTPLIIGIIYAIMLLRGGGEAPEGRGEAPAWFMEAMNNLMVYANVGLSLFVGWMLLGRLAGMGFSQEGKSYWMLKSAPLGTSHLIGAKFLVAYLPVVALSSAFLLVTWVLRRSDVMTLLFSFLVIALCTAGNAGLNLAFGILGANLAWEDPRQMQRTTSGCFGGLATMAYLPISLVLFFGPPLLAAALGLPVLVGQIAGLALGGVFSLACAATPPWLVRGRVARLGEG
jgi:ABC-2 type transport system permease protein